MKFAKFREEYLVSDQVFSSHCVYQTTCLQLWFPFLTRELRACARASYRYDVGNGIRSLARSLARSLDWSIPVNFF